MSITVRLEQRFYGTMMATWLDAQREWQRSPDVQREYDKRQHDHVYTLQPSAWNALLGFLGGSATGLPLCEPERKHCGDVIRWRAQHGSPTVPPEPRLANAPEVLPNQMPLFPRIER
jgi:hypothetical protein